MDVHPFFFTPLRNYIMATVPLFKNRKNCCVVGVKGTQFKFMDGRYWTTDEIQIEELMHYAKTKQAGIFIDPKEPTIDTEATTPMDVMKKKIIAEYLASQAEVKDAGNYHQSLQEQARAVVGTDESTVNGDNTMAVNKEIEQKVGTESPALAALKATAALKK